MLGTDTKVVSVGGSIINPGSPDVDFLAEFVLMIRTWLESHPEKRIIIVTGGGAVARAYQAAYREALPKIDSNPEQIASQRRQNEDCDWLGIRTTWLNAELLKRLFGEGLCPDPVVENPMGRVEFNGRVLIGAGYQPGYSSDNDAVMLATQFMTREVINLSNIKKVYTADPKKDPKAEPIDEISWSQFREMVGDEWTPGMNVPFDPKASQRAEENHIRVICADGKNIKNTLKILEGDEFIGTTIG